MRGRSWGRGAVSAVGAVSPASGLRADPARLADVGAVWRRVAVDLGGPAAVVRALARALGSAADTRLAAHLADLAERVGALGRVVAMVAADLGATEAGVAGSFVDFRASRELLTGLSPAALSALLVAAPTLAELVVDRSGPLLPGSVAARLAAVLASGEPPEVVLRTGRSLLLGLTERERQLLALLHPALVSGLASAPVADRVLATRVLVGAEVGRLRGALPGLAGLARRRAERRLAVCVGLLTGVVTLVGPDGRRTVRPHQLVAFDPRGDGRVAEVFGDVASARHLAVFVPGTGTSLERYAGSAARAASFAAAAPDLAVVLWQNADFPDQPLDVPLEPHALWDHPGESLARQLRGHDLAAAFRDAAAPAGAALAHDVAGLRMAVPGPDVTVLGHSYGGSIVGSAEAHGMVVDRVVHISSAGGYVSDVHDYAAGACGARRFSMTAPDDPIQVVQGVGGGAGSAVPVGHGLDPDRIPAVTRLDTGLRADGQGLVSGHSGMFEPGSGGWRNLLAVMRGQPVQVLEPGRWSHQLAVTGTDGRPAVPHFVVTRSPYDAPGYQPPVQPSVTPVCADHTAW